MPSVLEALHKPVTPRTDTSSTDHSHLIDDLDPSGQTDRSLICMIYVAHISGWEPYNSRMLDLGHASWVGSVPCRSCAAPQNGSSRSRWSTDADRHLSVRRVKPWRGIYSTRHQHMTSIPTRVPGYPLHDVAVVDLYTRTLWYYTTMSGSLCDSVRDKAVALLPPTDTKKYPPYAWCS